MSELLDSDVTAAQPDSMLRYHCGMYNQQIMMGALTETSAAKRQYCHIQMQHSYLHDNML